MKQIIIASLLVLTAAIAKAQPSSVALHGSVSTYKETIFGLEYQRYIPGTNITYGAQGSVFTGKRSVPKLNTTDNNTHVTIGPRLYLNYDMGDRTWFVNPGVGIDWHYANVYNAVVNEAQPVVVLKVGTYYGKRNDGLIYLIGSANFSSTAHIYSLGIGLGGLIHAYCE